MSIGNGTGKLSAIFLDAVGKIGIPGMLAMVLLYGIWRLGSELTAGHIAFLKAAERTMDRHRDEDAILHDLFQKLHDGQTKALLKQAEMEKNQEVLIRLLGDMKRTNPM